MCDPVSQKKKEKEKKEEKKKKRKKKKEKEKKPSTILFLTLVFSLVHFRVLSGNLLTQIPSQIGQMTSLKILYFSFLLFLLFFSYLLSSL
jgi:uncharacterized protein YqhQ